MGKKRLLRGDKMKCPICEHEAKTVKAKIERYGVEIETDVYRCAECKEEFLDWAQEGKAEELALKKLKEQKYLVIKVPLSDVKKKLGRVVGTSSRI
jgi:transposase-like protein